MKSAIDKSPNRDGIRLILKKKVGRKPSFRVIQADIQKKFKESYTDKQLRTYRDKLMGRSKIDSKTALASIQKRKGKISIVNERWDLYHIQLGRLKKMMKDERDGKAISALVEQAIISTGDILDSLKTDLQDLGLFPTASKDMNVNWNEVQQIQKMVISIAEVLPEDKKKILVERLEELQPMVTT